MSFVSFATAVATLPQAAHINPESVQDRLRELASAPLASQALMRRDLAGLTSEEIAALCSRAQSRSVLGDHLAGLAGRKLLELAPSVRPLAFQEEMLRSPASPLHDFLPPAHAASRNEVATAELRRLGDAQGWIVDAAPTVHVRDGITVFALHDLGPGASFTEDERQALLATRLNMWAALHVLAGNAAPALEVVSVDMARCLASVSPVAQDLDLGHLALQEGAQVWRAICSGQPLDQDLPAVQKLAFSAPVLAPVFAADVAALSGKLSQYQLSSSAPQSRTPEELSAEVEKMGALFTAWRVMGIEAEAISEALGLALREMVPVDAVGMDVESIDLGAARLKVQRNWDRGAVDGALTAKLASTGLSDEAIAATLSHPNYNTVAGFSTRMLAERIMEKFGVDIFSDPEFEDCIDTPSTPRLETRMALLRDLDTNNEVDYALLLDRSRSGVKIELARAPLAGAGRAAREELHRRLRHATQAQVEGAGGAYVRQLRQGAEEAPKPAKKPRAPRAPKA